MKQHWLSKSWLPCWLALCICWRCNCYWNRQTVAQRWNTCIKIDDQRNCNTLNVYFFTKYWWFLKINIVLSQNLLFVLHQNKNVIYLEWFLSQFLKACSSCRTPFPSSHQTACSGARRFFLSKSANIANWHWKMMPKLQIEGDFLLKRLSCSPRESFAGRNEIIYYC